MIRAPFETDERFALRNLLEAMETPRTQKASAAWDAAHAVIEEGRLAAHGYTIDDNRRFGAAYPYQAKRANPDGSIGLLSTHKTPDAAREALERDYRASL